MPLSRRRLIFDVLATGGVGLAGCKARTKASVGPLTLNPDALSRGFAPLAERARPGRFNLGVQIVGQAPSWCADPSGEYPMQGVGKAPLAAMALAEIDAGRLTLNSRITITEADLSPPPSRINTAFTGGPMSLPVADLIALTLQNGDNTAADVLMSQVGGPGAVTRWLTAKGMGDMRLGLYERETQTRLAGLPPFRAAWKDEADWAAARNAVAIADRESAARFYLDDPPDRCTATAALSFLNLLANGNLLSPTSTGFMMRLMRGTREGLARLHAGLPPGATLAHRPGAAATTLGLTPATNDIGLVTLADGRQFAVAGFLMGATATQAQRDTLFGDAMRMIVGAFA